MSEILTSSVKNKKNTGVSYTNILFQNIQAQNFTQKNFPVYQKNLLKILDKLMDNIHNIWTHITEENINNIERVAPHMKKASTQCRLLWEYCEFFKESTKEIPLPYRYLGDTAHKLKPYALSIQGFIDQYHTEKNAKIKKEDLEEVKTVIKIMIKEISKIKHYIKHMEFSHDLHYKKWLFSPRYIADDMIELQKPFSNKKRITIKNMLSEHHKVESYKKIFEIVMNNLITNAIKFTPEKGEITVGIENEYPNYITFFVKDTWIGIPEDRNIFEHGYTTLSTEWKQWTWLWLTQSKIFLEIIKGDISHRDNTPLWTIFSFTMPKKSSSR